MARGHDESNEPGRREPIAFGRTPRTRPRARTRRNRVPRHLSRHRRRVRGVGIRRGGHRYGAEALAALDSGETIILDLAAMTFIDSQGLKVLVEAHSRAKQGRFQRVVIRSPRPRRARCWRSPAWPTCWPSRTEGEGPLNGRPHASRRLNGRSASRRCDGTLPRSPPGARQGLAPRCLKPAVTGGGVASQHPVCFFVGEKKGGGGPGQGIRARDFDAPYSA